jgi:hypothetical protein
MELSRWVLKTEALLLLCALISSVLPGRLARAVTPLWWLSALVGAAYVGLRYWLSWPMTPMFSGSALFPPLLAVFGAISLRQADPDRGRLVRRWLIASALLVVMLSIAFPKDFYLPIVKTTSPFAHGVLIFGSLGRASLFVAGGWGLAALCGYDGVMQRMFRWIVWGFGWWTLSLFSGEVWSYSGWGVPMVWEDASTLTAIATWLFYVAVIHLHLSGLCSRRMRAALGVLGVVVIVVINGGPDLGPWRNPLAIGGRA